MFPWKDNPYFIHFFIHEPQYPVNLSIIHEERKIDRRGNNFQYVWTSQVWCPVWCFVWRETAGHYSGGVVAEDGVRGLQSPELPVSQSHPHPALPGHGSRQSSPAPVIVRPARTADLSHSWPGQVQSSGGNKSWYVEMVEIQLLDISDWNIN